MKINIRQVEFKDAEQLSKLSKQLGYPCPDTGIKENLENLIDDPDHLVLVAESNHSALAGFIHIFITKRLFASSFTEIGGLVVSDRCRGQGIGSLLLTEAENWSVSKDILIMRIRSNVIRDQARIFYLSNGYKIEKEQRVFSKNLPK
jgi:ribosomal protein S18 acetylase RimI-like enzyme